MGPSDDVKNIDWKATARTGKYYVREYLAESYYNLMILYDISNSVSFGRKELVQANIAVSLAYSAIVGNNGCGLILFADEVVSFLPPRMGRPHFMQILNAIAEAKPVPCGATRLDPALGQTRRRSAREPDLHPVGLHVSLRLHLPFPEEPPRAEQA